MCKMKTFREFVKWFLYILPGIIVVCGIGYTLDGAETVSVNVLWKILFSAFVTALLTTLMHVMLIKPNEEEGRLAAYLKLAIHYILLCAIMSFLGAWFGWIDFGVRGVLAMALYVGGVYLIACTVYYIIDVKQADIINKKLREKYGDNQ